MKLDGPYTLWDGVTSAVSGGTFGDAVLTRARWARAVLLELWDSAVGGTPGTITALDLSAGAGASGAYVADPSLYGLALDTSHILAASDIRDGACAAIVPLVGGSLIMPRLIKLAATKNATTDPVTLNGRAWYLRDDSNEVGVESSIG